MPLGEGDEHPATTINNKKSIFFILLINEFDSVQIYSFFISNNRVLAAWTILLIEAGIIKPVVDKVFPFDQTNDALAYVETGRAKGKVVIKVK